jgi:RNA polymerase sigma-70 factor (ECF subfamily)
MNEHGRVLSVPDTLSQTPRSDASSTRLRRIIDERYDFVWRAVRFLGVPEANAEDAAQLVFCVVARKLRDIAPEAESSFLFATASRVASEARRSARRGLATSDRNVDEIEAPLPTVDDLLDQRRARQTLDEVLGAMPIDLRSVFVLFEIEELTVPEIATAVGVRVGTAASRLRRAREEFRAILKRRNAAQCYAGRGGRP